MGYTKGGKNKFQGITCICRNCKHKTQGMKPGQNHRKCGGGEWVSLADWEKEQSEKAS